MYNRLEFKEKYTFNGSSETTKSRFSHFNRVLMLPLILGAFFCCLTIADAADWMVVPKVGVTGGYDDNILFQKENKIDSSFIKVKPGARLKYKTLLSDLTMNADWNILSYLDESDFDRVDHDYWADGDYQFTQRWDANVELRYRKDSTLNSYLEDTGRVIERLDRDYYYALGGLSYNITRTSWIGAEYSYEKSQYEDDEYPDYDRHRVKLRYDHRLKSEVDTVSIGPSYYYRTNDLNDTDYYSLDVGWDREWSNITNSFASIGVRYADIRYVDDDDEDRSEWGVRARVELNHKGLATFTNFEYYHDVDTTADGTDVNVDNFYLRYGFNITERLGLGIKGRLVFSYNLFTSEDGDDEVDDSRYYDVEPFMEYQILERLSMSLSYKYQNSSEDPIDSENVRGRNQVWLQFYYELPMKL